MSIKVDENDPIGELEPCFPYRDVTVRRNVDVKEFYDLESEIGRGKFGTVYRCREKSTGLTLAAKFVGIGRREDRRNVEREVQIMRMLQHPRIIQLYDACEAANVMCVIQELIEGGELFDRVIGDDFILTEKSCTVFVRQICEGVAFIHSKNVLHLDLKPENILCLTKTGNRIKIIDFGLARQYDPSKKLQVLFGTPEFVAPEVVNFDAIGFGTDMWSVGVICYVLLSGLSPFMGETDVETMANVTIAQYDFDDEAFDDISDDAKDFIRKLLTKDISCRYTAAESLKHPWLLRRPLPAPGLDTAKDNMRGTVERWEKEPTPPAQVIIVPQPTPEPERLQPKAEQQSPNAPQAKAAPQTPVAPQPKAAAQTPVVPQPTVEPQVSVAPQPKAEPQTPVVPQRTVEPQVSVAPQPKAAPQTPVVPQPTVEPQVSVAPQPKADPQPKGALIAPQTNKVSQPEASSKQTPESITKTDKNKASTPSSEEKEISEIRKRPEDLPSPSPTKQVKTHEAPAKSKDIKDPSPEEVKVSTFSWPKKRPSINSQTSLPEGKPLKSTKDVKNDSIGKFPLKPSSSITNTGNVFTSRIQQGGTEITISKKSLNPSPQPKIAGIVLGQTHPRESDSLSQKKQKNEKPPEVKPKVITHKIIVEGKDITDDPVSGELNKSYDVSQPANIDNQSLKHPLLKTLQNDRFERRCSDISCFMHDIGNTTDSGSIINEIKRLSSRFFDSDLLDTSNNNSTTNLLRQIANRGVVPRRPKFRVTNLNRDVPIGSPPPPTNMTYFIPPNLLDPDSYSSQTHSAPQSPRASPERMSQALDKDVILRLFNKLEGHVDNTSVTKKYVINETQTKISSISSK